MAVLYLVLALALVAAPVASEDGFGPNEIFGVDIFGEVIEPALEAASCILPCYFKNLIQEQFGPVTECINGVKYEFNSLYDENNPLAIFITYDDEEPDICRVLDSGMTCIIEHLQNSCNRKTVYPLMDVYKRAASLFDCGVREEKRQHLVRCLVLPIFVAMDIDEDYDFLVCLLGDMMDSSEYDGFIEDYVGLLRGDFSFLCRLGDRLPGCLPMIPAEPVCQGALNDTQPSLDVIGRYLGCFSGEPFFDAVCYNRVLDTVFKDGFESVVRALFLEEEPRLTRETQAAVDAFEEVLETEPSKREVEDVAEETCSPVSNLYEVIVRRLRGRCDDWIDFLDNLISPTLHYLNAEGCCDEIFTYKESLGQCYVADYPDRLAEDELRDSCFGTNEIIVISLVVLLGVLVVVAIVCCIWILVCCRRRRRDRCGCEKQDLTYVHSAPAVAPAPVMMCPQTQSQKVFVIR